MPTMAGGGDFAAGVGGGGRGQTDKLQQPVTVKLGDRQGPRNWPLFDDLVI